MGKECKNDVQPRKLLRQYGWLIFCTLILGLFLAGVHCLQSRCRAEAVLSYGYDGAAQGLTPNGMWLDVSQIRNERILQDALEYLGLEDRVTPAELSAGITITPVGEKAVLGREDYFCTDYRITMDTAAFSLGEYPALQVLAGVCDAYQTFFWQNYGDNQSILTQPVELDADELPARQLAELELRIRQLTRYLTTRLEQSSRFTVLNKKAQLLTDHALPEARALLETGLLPQQESAIRALADEVETLRMDLLALDTDHLAAQQQNGLIVRMEEDSFVQRIAPGRTGLELALFFLVGCILLCWKKGRKAGVSG